MKKETNDEEARGGEIKVRRRGKEEEEQQEQNQEEEEEEGEREVGELNDVHRHKRSTGHRS